MRSPRLSLIIALSGYAPQDAERKLVIAAGEAGVRWILPDEWSPDTANEALVDDVFVFQPKGKNSAGLIVSITCTDLYFSKNSQNHQ